METDRKNQLSIDKISLKAIFREYIEETRLSIEKKTQEMISLIHSINEENELHITKSK